MDSTKVKQTNYPFIGIVGPTASGKSDLAVYLAGKLSGEIINCDSVQVYRGMDIGTAKVSRDVQREIPHHLLDIIGIDEYFSAGRFSVAARETLLKIRRRGHLPILAGGTGFYLRTLLHGIFEGPGRDDEIRDRFKKIVARKGVKSLYRILTHIDPDSAERISPNDYQRIARALEVYYLTEKPMSRHFGENEQELEGFDMRIYCLQLPRPALNERINFRVVKMFEKGLVQEVRRILDSGYSHDAKGLEAIGYREVVAHIRGELTYEEAMEKIQMATRRFAKRQMTWFRKEKDLVWITGAGEDPSVQKTVLEEVERFLDCTGFSE